MYEKASLGISFIFLLTKMGHEKQIIIIIITNNNNNNNTGHEVNPISNAPYRGCLE